MKKSVLAYLLIIMILLVGCKDTQSKVSDNTSFDGKIDPSYSQTVEDNSSEDLNSENTNPEEDDSKEIFDDSWADDMVDEPDVEDSFWDDLVWDDSGFGDSEDGEEGIKAYYKEIIPPTNTAYLMNNISGGADKEANTLRESINKSKDELKITGQKYYVSPNGNDSNDGKTPETAWKTLDNVMLSAFLLKKGDAVLLERGGVYRLSSTFRCKSDITYSAYGEGNKPLIYGSSQNYAWGKLWKPSNKKNVWKLKLETSDAGIIVFDHGKVVGTKKTNVGSLKMEGDFYHNQSEGLLYLYVEGAYPNVKYTSIEIGTDMHIIGIPQKSKNIIIDNLCLKYTGAHGISAGANTSNIKITNCEIGWVGGSYYDPVNNPGSRYGNGIEFWLSCEDIVVDNCWIYQVFDTGFSYQGKGDLPAQKYKNISVKNTLIELCTMSIEVWDHTSENSIVENVEFSNNIFRFSGYGWATQRGNFAAAAHFTDYGGSDDYIIKNLIIKDNIFDCSAQSLVYYTWNEGIERGIIVSNNSFYQKTTKIGNAIYYGTSKQMVATNAEELLVAVKTFDPNPKIVKWVS